jgi:hypothetical protein
VTSASNHEDHAEQVLELAHGPVGRRSLPVRRAAATIAALLVLAAGCGGSNGPGVPSAGSNKANHAPAAGSSSGGVMAQFLAYSRCMRSHGIHDFPDPSSAGGGVGIELHGGPGSDLNRNDPRFEAAEQACRALQPGGGQPTTPSAQKIAAEVKWARCMRSHGLPSFPDPNGQGAFDRNKFDENSSAFQTASNACKSLRSGPLPVY